MTEKARENRGILILTIGKKLREARLRSGLKADVVAELSGLSSVQTLYGYEKDRREPNLPTLSRLCRVLQITPNQLLDFSDFDRELFKQVAFATDAFQQSRSREITREKRLEMYFAIYDLLKQLPEIPRDNFGQIDLSAASGLLKMISSS